MLAGTTLWYKCKQDWFKVKLGIIKSNLVQELDSGGLDMSGISSFISWVVEEDNSTRHKEEEAAIMS